MRFAWPMLLLAGCWPYLSDPYESYVDGDSDDEVDTSDVDTSDVDTSDPDTSDLDTSDPDTSDPDTNDPDTGAPGPLYVTVQQLRRGDIAEGTEIRVAGVVVTTPQLSNGFWVQAGSGTHAGIYIYNGDTPVPFVDSGDRLDIVGTYAEFESGSAALAEIVVSSASDLVVTGRATVPAPAQLTHADIASRSTAELWESSLVTIGQSEVTVGPDGFGEYIVEPLGGGSQVRVHDAFFSDNPPPGAMYGSITGVLNYAFGSYRIEPRSGDDLVQDIVNPGCPAQACAEDFIPGDLLITEISFNPPMILGEDADNEFVEVLNRTTGTVSLDGLIIGDLGGSAVVSSSTILPSGGYAVIGRRSISGWGWDDYGIELDGTYAATINFGNSVPEAITLSNSSGQISASVAYSTSQANRTWSLDPDSYFNPGDQTAWCYSTTAIAGGNGTPGAVNDDCAF